MYMYISATIFHQRMCYFVPISFATLSPLSTHPTLDKVLYVLEHHPHLLWHEGDIDLIHGLQLLIAQAQVC